MKMSKGILRSQNHKLEVGLETDLLSPRKVALGAGVPSRPHRRHPDHTGIGGPSVR